MFAIQNLKSFAGKTVSDGMRVARIIAKSGKVEGRESESMGVMIPAINMGTALTIVNTDSGKKWLADKLESIQDQIIRAKYASGAGSGLTVCAEDIDAAAILVEIDKAVIVMEAGRAKLITAKSIEAWFQADMYQKLNDALKAKGLPDATIKVTIAAYLDKFQTLSARGENRYLEPSVIAQLRKCIALLDDDYNSELVEEMLVRMDNIKDKPAADLDAL